MTKEDWAKAQEALNSMYQIVRLNADGYEVALQLVRVSAYRNAIAIYIGNVFKGEWIMGDCEERRRFVQKKERSLLSPKEKAKFKKLPKKIQKELDIDRKYEFYQTHWSSFGALKKHLIANNKDIALVSIGIE